VGSWWRQSVTVAYEQARGLRQKHQMPDGYQISRSRTIAALPERIYAAWVDGAQRARWLPDPGFTLRTERPHKSLRLLWVDGRSTLDVSLYPRGENKTQVTVQHNKLSDAETAQAMKDYWADALKRLEELLGK
jgi:uncharacterized protein YndB with AHSA1/START domain